MINTNNEQILIILINGCLWTLAGSAVLGQLGTQQFPAGWLWPTKETLAEEKLKNIILVLAKKALGSDETVH